MYRVSTGNKGFEGLGRIGRERQNSERMRMKGKAGLESEGKDWEGKGRWG